MTQADITGLLREWSQGNSGAMDKLIPVVYSELHRIARVHIAREQPGRTLQASALVHEAYLRLVGYHGAGYQDRAHFFAVSAQIMRRILVDAARERSTARRGGGGQRVTLEKLTLADSGRDVEIVALDEEGLDPARLARSVAERRAAQLAGTPVPIRKRRLLSFLKRRGFDGRLARNLAEELCLYI